FSPTDSDLLYFTAIVGGASHPFSIRRNGMGAKDLSQVAGYTYGINLSPDGKKIAYQTDYQVYIAHADGSNAERVVTGNSLNFLPKWSPDGTWLLFLSGTPDNASLYLVESDGSNGRTLADRGGYAGTTDIMDVPDFHGGSSDIPTWNVDSRSVFFT